MQTLKKSLAQKAAPKRPEWPSYGNLGKVTQNPHFLKKSKVGTKVNFSKIAQKVALRGTKKTLRQMALSSYKYALIAPRLEKIMAQNASPKAVSYTHLTLPTNREV